MLRRSLIAARFAVLAAAVLAAAVLAAALLTTSMVGATARAEPLGWAAQLEDPDPRIRIHAFRAIADASEADGVAESLEQIAAGLRAESDPAVRAAGRDAMARIPIDEAALRGLLADSDEVIARAWSAYALGHHPTTEALDALIAAIGDPEEEVRREVYNALGRGRDRSALHDLQRAAVRDPSAALRRRAERAALALASGRPGLDVTTQLALLTDGDPDDRARAAQALGASGDWRARRPLEAVAAAGDPAVRKAALLALGHLSDQRAVPAIVAILDSSAGEVHYAAIGALAWLKDDSAIPTLTGLLGATDPTARQLAVRALAWTGHAGCAESLRPWLADPVEKVRLEVIQSMEILREPARVGVLIEALGDPSPFARAEAARILASTGAIEAGPPLVALLKDGDPLVRLSAADGVAGLGRVEALPQLRRLATKARTDEQRGLYEKAIRALEE